MCVECFGFGRIERPAKLVEYERTVVEWGVKVIQNRHYELPDRIDACPECTRRAEEAYQLHLATHGYGYG
mgnify:CR=1 FL=1